MIKRYRAILLFLTGSGFILFGVFREENKILFIKAINICLECIGVG